MAPPDKDTITVYFGGEARERWTGDGLRIDWSGRLCVPARREEGGRYVALAPDSACPGDNESDCGSASKARELALLLNAGSAPPLTAAYFSSAATAAEALRLCGDDPRDLPQCLSRILYGGFEALVLLELLRLLLDEHALSWEEATSVVARCFAFRAEKSDRAPRAAVAALSPRLLRLAEAVGGKLYETLRRVFPGDRRRLASAAVTAGDEVDFGILCAALCGKIICPKEKRAGEFRTLFVAMPNKFEDMT